MYDIYKNIKKKTFIDSPSISSKQRQLVNFAFNIYNLQMIILKWKLTKGNTIKIYCELSLLTFLKW